MKFPKEGEKIKNFTIEAMKVEHVSFGSGKYEYPTEITVTGKGGKKGVRETFKPYFDQRITLFSGYGNPYQCQGGKMHIESLGENRYKIIARGSCVRIFLKRELDEFLQYLIKNNQLTDNMESPEREELIEDYVKNYHKKTRV